MSPEASWFDVDKQPPGLRSPGVPATRFQLPSRAGRSCRGLGSTTVPFSGSAGCRRICASPSRVDGARGHRCEGVQHKTAGPRIPRDTPRRKGLTLGWYCHAMLISPRVFEAQLVVLASVGVWVCAPSMLGRFHVRIGRRPVCGRRQHPAQEVQLRCRIVVLVQRFAAIVGSCD